VVDDPKQVGGGHGHDFELNTTSCAKMSIMCDKPLYVTGYAAKK
jgi:hypothetical protein